MKNDIKKLYKKDKKLAIQVAKALGMKIKVKAEKLSINDFTKKIKKLLKEAGANLIKIQNVKGLVHVYVEPLNLNTYNSKIANTKLMKEFQELAKNAPLVKVKEKAKMVVEKPATLFVYKI